MKNPSLQAAIERAYGQDYVDLPGQVARYQRGLHAFTERYGPGPVYVFRAPGRVNLIGEHTDYNHGYVLPLALDKDVLLYARPRQDGTVRLANMEPWYDEHVFQIARHIPRQPLGHWANYVQGPAAWLAEHHETALTGFDGLVDGRAPWGVPRGAGLSSSSALTVVSAVALVTLNHIDLQGARLADACGQAEWYVGTRGGVMDQFISILAQQGQALFLDCRPRGDDADYAWQQVPIPGGYALVVIDSQVKHRNTGPAFNQRVAECRIGVRLLRQYYPGITHLRDLEDRPWSELAARLPETITAQALASQGIDLAALLDQGTLPEAAVYQVRRRCRHVITENRRVLETVKALQAGDMAQVVALMAQAHASARDDYEISVPEIENLVSLVANLAPSVGARLTGAGWGGCLVVLSPIELISALEDRLAAYYNDLPGQDASFFVCQSANGAGLVYTFQSAF